METIRNIDMDSADRLSELPDDIILKVFSSLATENTIATSVLSKRWKEMWKEMKSLKFDSKLHKTNFSDHVITALTSYRNPTLQSLTIRVAEICDPMDLTIWVAIAYAKNISKLVLRLEDLSEAIIFPHDVLSRRNKMKILKLMGRMYLNLDHPIASLHCLREMHLYHVRFHNESSLTHLLKGCSVLENLVIVIYITSGILNITIDVPSLLKLTLRIENCVGENLIIRTPRLLYLDMKELECVSSINMETAPNLSDVRICRHIEDMTENILESIPSVQNLSIAAPLTYPIGKTYHWLKTLALDTKEDEWWNLLTHLLNCSPNLEILKIFGGWFRYWGAKWTPPQYVPPCLLSRLHTLEWKTYIWDESDDKEVANFILRNAHKLRNATFTIHTPTNSSQLRRMNEMLNKLSNVARASPSCILVFEDSAFSKRKNIIEEDPDALDFTR